MGEHSIFLFWFIQLGGLLFYFALSPLLYGLPVLCCSTLVLSAGCFNNVCPHRLPFMFYTGICVFTFLFRCILSFNCFNETKFANAKSTREMITAHLFADIVVFI